MAISATIKAIKEPIRINSIPELLSNAGSSFQMSYTLFAVAAHMVGMARKKENSAASDLVSFCCIPPIMVAAERLKPGKATAKTWKRQS